MRDNVAPRSPTAEGLTGCALSALEELLESPLELPSPLDELLDAFAVLKREIDKARRATSTPAQAHARPREQHGGEATAATGAMAPEAALLDRAERRLDALTEAVTRLQEILDTVDSDERSGVPGANLRRMRVVMVVTRVF